MRVIDNQHPFLKDDLARTIKPHVKRSIAAASFSLYAFAEPAFTADKPEKEKREFYIQRLNSERDYSP